MIPPKISADTIKFPDPDRREENKKLADGLRESIISLKYAIGNDSNLEGKLIDCRRFVDASSLSISTIQSEIAHRANKRGACKHNDRGDCLLFLVLKIIEAWHQYVDTVSGGHEDAMTKYLELFTRIHVVIDIGLLAHRVVGTELTGFHLEA